MQPLDTTVLIVTPENIAFEHRLAGPFRRLPAFLFDLLIKIGVVLSLGIALGMLLAGGFGTLGLFLVLFFALDWGYGGVFETFWNGQTPGKRLLRIRVVSTGGLPISGQQAMLRNVLKAFDKFYFMQYWGLFLLAEALSFFLSRRMQRLGDLAADTMVVVDSGHRLGRLQTVEGRGIEEMLELVPVGFQADAGLAEALASYVGRRAILAPPRRREVAGHLARPLADRFGLDETVDPDLLLCAVYRRVYL